MAYRPHPFIDIVALDPIRAHFVDARAMAVIAPTLDAVLWTNGPGAHLLGFEDVISATGASLSLGFVAKRQIQAMHGFPDAIEETALSLRLFQHGGSATQLIISSLILPDGAKALLLRAPASGIAPELSAALEGIYGDGQHAAIIDRQGHALAADPDFPALELTPETLASALQHIGRDGAVLFKSRVEAQNRALPCGIVRLRDDLHLLITVDETMQEGRPASRAPEAEQSAIAVSQMATEAAEGWHFEHTTNDAGEIRAEEAQVQSRSPEISTPAETVTQTARHTESWIDERPIRFVWRTDAEARLSLVSEEFVYAVGQRPDDLLGVRFAELTQRLRLDDNGEISGLLERRDTWSGRVVHWPVGDSEWLVPVELAALPTYDRDRNFEGFRGFGIARMNEAFRFDENMADAGVAAANRPEQKPADVAPAAPAETMPEKPTPRGHLNNTERAAFREIAERLRPLARRQNEEAQASLFTTVNQPGEASKPAESEPSAKHTEPSSIISHPAEGKDDDRIIKHTIPETSDPAPHSTPRYSTSRLLGDEHLFAEPATTHNIDASSPEELEDASRATASTEATETVVAEESTGASKADAQAEEFALYEREAAREARTMAPQDTSLLDTLPVAVLVHAGDLLHYANETFFTVTGYTDLGAFSAAGGIEELFGEPYAPEPVDESSNETRRTMRLFDANGDERPVKAYLQSISWQGAKALLLAIVEDDAAIVQDANAALEAQVTELSERLEEMRTIVDTATDGVILINNDETIRSISHPAEALFGFDSHQMAGKPFPALFAIESQRPAQDYLRSLANDGVASLMNDGREVIGREAQGRFIPLFMTVGKLPNGSGFCAVVRDITSWKQAEADLKSARLRAEEASSQKTDFLARVSHEIRTPLNAIIGFSELMMDEKLGPLLNERYRDYLRDINRSGTHVLDLVNDLLDISKIEAGAQEMSYEAVSLTETLAETVALMQPQANRERVIIRSSYASNVPEVVADLRSVRQIALNLVSNAIRYTQPGGQVIISTSYEPNGEVIVKVRDTGAGMTQSEIEHALKPFKQINALKRTRGDGTGLGLPLTKAMVEANRARFSISSTPGVGTVVEITFPPTRVLAE
ncbi:PAS domain-containing protein [Limoniibacter endophyticus]|uniref:histidine kinase n=1 Tax=Limoniibacter endophyticus TaxID=1565040 RepID=A0A8J3DHN6_9HYPH|nr:PAS domain-containing protein [Limoniibacter endophyticus]GHC67736.1 ATPase [Limoniibacter endophyticus]